MSHKEKPDARKSVALALRGKQMSGFNRNEY
jgi:hypothetical protein